MKVPSLITTYVEKKDKSTFAGHCLIEKQFKYTILICCIDIRYVVDCGRAKQVVYDV